MTSRHKILSSITSSKPDLSPLPSHLDFDHKTPSSTMFRDSLQGIGGRYFECATKKDVQSIIKKLFPNVVKVASNVVDSNSSIIGTSSTEILELMELTVLQGELGVAENGAVWLPEKNMMNRALPFITQHLILLLYKENIVANMHQAYARVNTSLDYGVFIAGPSKTADIEQSLVIGAHGARSTMVIVIHDPIV